MSFRSLFRLRPLHATAAHPARDWRQVYRSHHRTLAGMFYKMGVHRREELDDLVQDTFLEAYRSADSLSDPEKLLPWLKTIGRRQFVKRTFRQKVPEVGGDQDIALNNEEAPDQSPENSLEDRLHAGNLCQAALLAISQIKAPEKRQALTLFYLGEAPLKEISANLGIKVSTLTTWTSRFRKEFLDQVAQQDLLAADSEHRPRTDSPAAAPGAKSARVTT